MSKSNNPQRKRSVSFRTDPRIALILGEGYRSSEHALRELVDNAWDADASNVWIELPEPLSKNPVITIKDDGNGMNERALRAEYLNIASSNYSRKGGKTPQKQRPIRGRKGVGKFAGLMLADSMIVSSTLKGQKRSIRISKDTLRSTKTDIGRLKIPITSTPCQKDEHGTEIELSGFSQNHVFPMRDKLEELLARDYTRTDDFTIFIDNRAVMQQSLRGQTSEIDFDIALPSSNGAVTSKLTITLTWLDKPISQSKAGIVIKVNGKTVGKPQFFGLDELENIPRSSLRCLVGTIAADCLGEFVAPDWGGLFESAKPVQEVFQSIARIVQEQAQERFKKEIDRKRKKLEDYADKRLKDQPEARRHILKREFMALMEKYYKESFEKIESIAELALNALERDEYFELCKHIQKADRSDIASLAKTLEDFGLYEITVIGRQANARIAVLDSLDELIRNKDTDEKAMHKALENNLWFFGHEYSLFASNKSLRTIAEQLSVKISSKKSSNRPDLILTQNPMDEILLIEFKAPSKTISRDTEAQANKYRDELLQLFAGRKIELLMIGGKVDATIPVDERRPYKTYADLISAARNRFSWLIKELKQTR